MLLIDSLAEERILAAARRGELDNLPGNGEPLAFDDNAVIPEELRVAYRLLKNADCLPPDLSLKREISEVEALLLQAETQDEQETIRRRLCLLKTRLALAGRESNLFIEDASYRQKVMCKLTASDQ